MFARGVGDRGDAGFRGELFRGREPGAVVAELGQDLGGVDLTAAGQALQERAVRVLVQGGRDRGGQLLDLRDEGREDRDQGVDEFAAGLGLRLPGATERGGAQPGQQFGGGAAAAVGVTAEELGQAALAEPLGALGGGVAREERQGNRRIDIGEDRRGPRPEALEERPELIGQGDALGDEVIATPDQSAEGAGLVRQGLQGTKAVPIGSEQIGEQVGVAGVALAAGCGVAGPAGLHDVGVDGNNAEARGQERVDHEARGALEGHGQRGREAEAGQTVHQLGEAGGRVGRRPAPADRPSLVDYADGVCGRRPVHPDEEGHCASPWECETLPRERSRRSLTDWRSGLQLPLALHPVAGWGLSSCGAGELVSSRPSRGQPTWLSPSPGTVPAVSIRSSRPRHQETQSPSASRIEDLEPTHISVSPPLKLLPFFRGRVGQ